MNLIHIQSLRSINHAVSKVLGSGTVTEEVVKELDQEWRQYRPDMLDVLDIAATVYYLDNQPETHPIGLGSSRIEAHYKFLVVRPSLRHAVTTNMAEQCHFTSSSLLKRCVREDRPRRTEYQKSGYPTGSARP